MSNDNNQPQDQLKEAIKSAVSSANDNLEKMQSHFNEWKKPVVSTLQSVEHQGALVANTVTNLYQRRHEYAPELIGGTTLATGGYFLLRRGRLAGLLGGAMGAGAAYAVVYDEFQLDKVPEVLFGEKK